MSGYYNCHNLLENRGGESGRQKESESRVNERCRGESGEEDGRGDLEGRGRIKE
jgi:hypothetical protein